MTRIYTPAELQAGETTPVLKSAISSKYAHRDADWRFPRQQTNRAIELERSAPLRAWAADILTALLMIALIAIAWVIAGNIADGVKPWLG